MAAANFKEMKYNMPMICGRTCEHMETEYLKEYGEEITDDEFYMQEQDDFEYATKLAEEFTSCLTFHEVTVIAGWHESFQFYVEEKYFNLDKKSEYCIDNENAHYFFGMCRSKVLRAADAEKRKIKKWLHELVKKGYNEVVCTAMFSNGEAMYSIVTPGTQMTAAARA